MTNILLSKSNLLTKLQPYTATLQHAAGYRWTADNSTPPQIHNKKMKTDRKLLRAVQKSPMIIPPDKRRKMYLTRGFCKKEDGELKHQQYGVVVLDGGLLKFKHFNTVMNLVNKFTRGRDLAAEWRVPDPYHAVTKHPVQAVMGGGKGKINYYVTPIKARQVVFELYGNAEFDEVYPMLKTAAHTLPMPARAVHYNMLNEMYEEERRIEEENENFFTFREIVTKNMQNCRRFVSAYDLRYFGKIR